MIPGEVLAVAGSYVALLFFIAFATDALAAKGRARFLASPLIYTLSLAVYCTSWTFYGAVGTAVRSGLEFVTIYIGPTLVLMAWWLFLRKLIVVARAQRITSIADFLSARYGKSRAVSVLVTLIALASITPYIALQLIAVSRSFEAMVGESALAHDVAFWTAALMAFFVIVFGTRRLNADESQPGIVAAIAFESVVKLAALLAVATFAFVVLRGGDGETQAVRDALSRVGALRDDGGARWIVLTTLSAAAIVCLPRQFQVAVVENRNVEHLAVASWLFPLYLFLITVAVLPIAAAGLTVLPAGTEPDLFVISLPLSAGADGLALFAFIGGLSAATSMVIVACSALAVMISNHLVAPFLAERAESSTKGFSQAILRTRRVAIVVLLALGYLYASARGGEYSLASIGLIAFAGVAQFAPALVAALFWRKANRRGATAGLAAGALVWLATLLLPSFGVGVGVLNAIRALLLPPELAVGPNAIDPLVFGASLSLVVNIVVFVATSLGTAGGAMDQLQATLFVDALTRGGPPPLLRRSANRRDLFRLTQRVLGPVRAHALFAGPEGPGGDAGGARREGPVDSAFVAAVEAEIAKAVGTSSAHALIARVATGEPLTVDTAIALLSETQEAIRAARTLGVRSVELEHTAAELRSANTQLTNLLAEKDEFLSRVSHEMRTPVTAVRAFAELLAEGDLDTQQSKRFVQIISAEAERLTRLLDNILDLARLEAGVSVMAKRPLAVAPVMAAAADAMAGLAVRQGVELKLADAPDLIAEADDDRLKQVLINLIANAIRFAGEGDERVVTLSVCAEEGNAVLRVSDRGPGVDEAIRQRLFTKFGGGASQQTGKGAGLGLAISRQIMTALGGSLVLESTGPDGSVFAVRLPLAQTSPRA